MLFRRGGGEWGFVCGQVYMHTCLRTEEEDGAVAAAFAQVPANGGGDNVGDGGDAHQKTRSGGGDLCVLIMCLGEKTEWGPAYVVYLGMIRLAANYMPQTCLSERPRETCQNAHRHRRTNART